MGWSLPAINVSAFVRLTNSLELVIKLYTTRREKLNYMTLQESQMSLFEESDVWTLSVEDFRARLSQLQETDEVLKIHEELSSLKSQGLLPYSNLSIYSSRTSRGLLAMIKGIPLRQSSDRWMNWGMMSNGKCLTAKILEYHKTEKGATLSDILEEQVEDKYFLSLKQDQINQLCN